MRLINIFFSIIELRLISYKLVEDNHVKTNILKLLIVKQ